MRFLALLLVLATLNAHASYPELFGASFSTSGIGNQSNLDANDPSNNYYAPSVLGFSDKFNVLAQATSTAVHFKKIDGITVTNGTNSNNAATTGSARTDYPKFYGTALHAAVPVGGHQHLGTLAFSIFLPIGDLVRSNSGDAFLPEYVMFQSRHQRTSAFVNFAKKWSDDLAYSLGAILGFQATADVKTNMSLNGANYGSWASGQSKVSPSVGVIASVTKRFENMSAFFTYQQEMKSNLKAIVHGEITNPSLALFDATMASMIFYDPHTFRLGTQFSQGDFEYYAGVEYQMWTNYKAPTMSVAKNGGVIVPSTNYEKIVTRDTINPRLGVKVNLTDRWSTLLGAQYRMTPLKGDFSGSGNSIDSNTIVGTGGLQYRMVIWSKDVHLGASLQYHHLMDKRVTKTANQENGTAGPKIGAPGYDIGGYILAGSLGVKFNF
jgi:hypothetical protein